MSSAAKYVQSPAATLDYLINWAPYLTSPPAQPGDTITTSSWLADTGITITDLGHTDTTTSVRVTAGTLGGTYNAVNTITTSGGRTDERTLTFMIREL
jgi:hypothetical protein